jgi:predicted RNase H-like HicB family nuclease
MPQHITVRIEHDPKAGVWYIAESSLFGLHLEGETPDALRAKLPGAIRDLVPDPGPTPFDLITPGLVPA